MQLYQGKSRKLHEDIIRGFFRLQGSTKFTKETAKITKSEIFLIQCYDQNDQYDYNGISDHHVDLLQKEIE